MKETERMNFADLALLEDELYEAKVAAGENTELKGWKRVVDNYLTRREQRELHLVNRKIYLLLTFFLGWLGVHRFYEKRWKLGILYLVLSITGLPISLAVVDFIIALPKKADEKGCIYI